MTNEYRMNQRLNPYTDLNFEKNLDQKLAELMGLEDAAAGEPIGPIFSFSSDYDPNNPWEGFFDDYNPACTVIHTSEEDLTTEAILADIEEECERWAREDAEEFRGFDDFDPDFGREVDPEDNINWEDFIFCIMEEREAAQENLKLHFKRMEAEAYLELDCTSSDVGWYAGSVLKHLSLMKRAGAMLSLLPTEAECRRTLNILNGMEQ